MQKHAKRQNTAPESTMYPFYNNNPAGSSGAGLLQPQHQTHDDQVFYKPIDVNYNFVRSLFLDGVLEN